jgi:hypothetical protein
VSASGGPVGGPAAEPRRDRPATPFARILSAFLQAQPGVVGAVFLDMEGECIDYASSRDPYDVMVFGATLVQPTLQLLHSDKRLRAGAPILWVLEAEHLDALVRRVSDEHLLALWLQPNSISARVLHALGPLAELLRQEAGLAAPAWDPEGEPLEVETRAATGWGYAPHTMRSRDQTACELEVLGRWAERGSVSTQEAVCFRVRCAGHELTLVHERALNRWYRR